MTLQEATNTLFKILYEQKCWNHDTNEAYPHDETLRLVGECLSNGADLSYIHPYHRVPPILFAIEHLHHPDIIQLLAQGGTMLDFKRKSCDYVYDPYIGEDYVVYRYNSIMNSLLSIYLSTIGESMEDRLVDKYTKRKYLIETLHYPLDTTDYLYCVDLDGGESYTGPFHWDELDLTVQIENCIEQNEPSYYFYYNTSAHIHKPSDLISQYNTYEIHLLKEYCKILDINYTILSTIEEELPDD